jgi:peptide/nickel transport system permease protein
VTAQAAEFDSRDSWRKRKSQESMLFSTVDKVLHNPQGIIAVSGLLLLIFAAIFAGLITQDDPLRGTASGRLLSPSFAHPFGTDELRRDLLARTLYGLRTSLAVSIFSVRAGATAGICIGFISGYSGGWVERIAMRIVDALLAFPGLLTALAILTILGAGSRNVAIAIAIFNVPAFARLARSQMLIEKNKDYVYASQSLGAGPLRVIFGHISRNAIPPLLTKVSLAMAAAVVISASLSYLGLGERPPEPSLGGLLNSSRGYLRTAWWYALCPGAVLAFLLLCLNFLADAVNEATSPSAKRRM